VSAGKITAEEAKVHPSRNVITRTLGISTDMMADGNIHAVKDGDYVLLCSDGLTNMLSDAVISDIIFNGKGSLSEKTDELMNLANENGGIDNISVIIISAKEVDKQ
jgi:protein phosphatase